MTEKRVIKLKTPDSERPVGEGQVIIQPFNGLRQAMMDKLNSSRNSNADSEFSSQERPLHRQ